MSADEHLEDYYKELGIDKEMKHAKPEAEYKVTKKSEVAADQKMEAQRKKGDVIDALLDKTRADVSHKSLERVL